MVEISRNAKIGRIYIAAYDVQSPESLLINIDEAKSNDITE